MMQHDANSPTLSIIVPVYNRHDIVMETLHSIASQTEENFDLIVVDNGSTDGSYELLQREMPKFARNNMRTRLLRQPKPGASCARNMGLRAVETDWTLFFDSDDIMLPGHIHRFMEAARHHRNADAIGAPVLLHDGHKQLRQLPFGQTMALHLMQSCWSTQRYMARTSLFRKAGGWNEQLTGWDDFELGVRLLLKEPDVVAIDGQPLVRQFQHADSISRLDFSHDPLKWERSLDAIAQLLDSRDEMKYVAARNAMLAANYLREGHPELATPRYRLALEQCSIRHRAAIKLIYHTVSLTGHGGPFLALRIL